MAFDNGDMMHRKHAVPLDMPRSLLSTVLCRPGDGRTTSSGGTANGKSVDVRERLGSGEEAPDPGHCSLHLFSAACVWHQSCRRGRRKVPSQLHASYSTSLLNALVTGCQKYARGSL